MGYQFKMDFRYLDNLISDDQAVLEQAWVLFINNFLEAVPEVRREIRQQVVIKADSWQGHGMGQASLSRMMYTWIGVRILTSDWMRYRDVFVIALALYYCLPNLPKDLVGEYAEAAFKLCDKLDGIDDMVDGDDNKDKAKGAMPMPWDAPHITLLPHLLDCWNNTWTAMDEAGKGRLLKDVPFVSELLHEGQCNTHRGDRANKNAQLYKNWQTHILQVLQVAVESVLQG